MPNMYLGPFGRYWLDTRPNLSDVVQSELEQQKMPTECLGTEYVSLVEHVCILFRWAAARARKISK